MITFEKIFQEAVVRQNLENWPDILQRDQYLQVAVRHWIVENDFNVTADQVQAKILEFGPLK